MAITKWTIDPAHSEIGFKVKHLMITNVSGRFNKLEAEVLTDNENFSTAQIDIKIKAASVQTGNIHRDEHLRNPDFFDAKNHPEILFSSTELEKIDNEHFVLYGKLTIKGITKAVALKVEYSGITKDPWGGQRAGLTITGRLKRTDFGFSFNAALESGGLVVGEDVTIGSEVQLVKQVAVAAA